MLLERLKRIVETLYCLSESGLLDGFALIGGLAVSTWSTPRATTDVDLLVLIDVHNLKRFVSELNQLGIFAEFRRGGTDDPVPYLIRADQENMIVSVRKLEADAVRNSVRIDIGSVSVPVVPSEHLLLLKLKAGGPKDLMDARELFLSETLDKVLLLELAKRFHCTKLLEALHKDSR